MKQGDIYWANLNPTQGSEQSGLRPVLILSGNAMNDNLPIILACPITSKVKNYPGCLTIKANQENGLREDAEVISFQIRSLAKQRLTQKIGKIPQSTIKKVIYGLNEVLTL